LNETGIYEGVMTVAVEGGSWSIIAGGL